MSVVGSPTGRLERMLFGENGLSVEVVELDSIHDADYFGSWRRPAGPADGRRRGQRKDKKEKTRKQGGRSGVHACVWGCTYMAEPHVALGGRQVHLYGEAA